MICKCNDKNGFLFNEDKLIKCDSGGEGFYAVGINGVEKIFATGDDKVEFICYLNGKVIAYVKSKMGYPAIYPLLPASMNKPLKAVLMDLDGTSVRSEEFWIWIIEQTTAKLLDNPKFSLEQKDMPFVSGHSVSEHLKYCIHKYCPDKTVEEARCHYFDITRFQMQEIVNGRGRKNAFKPTEGLKDFLYALKAKNIKIGLVTSGLYEKAWPEILDAFRQLDMGDPCKFYDAIINAGYSFTDGQPGTLGELEPKPHPWLYAETARIGLGIDFEHRHQVIGIEDSGAGVVSIRLAGFTAIGIADGNIIESKTDALCSHYCKNFEEILNIIS
ncbi:MAG: haloacid dehalogenase [Planctomycetes bacterium GWF2_41_51]|nr:MAG: haloacid dehalogenase [Planctomycetes bacterium GWF2_41_51]HBG25585.1 haloacid dehalogenase [Phycisphaerales bacterium]